MKGSTIVLLVVAAGAVAIYLYLQQPTNLVNQTVVSTAMNDAMGV
jgi:hypothetical protein